MAWVHGVTNRQCQNLSTAAISAPIRPSAGRAGVNNRAVQMLAGYPFRHWSVASSRTVLANRVLKVRQDTCVIPTSGGTLEYFVLELAVWVNVVPVTSERELVMVRQYRHATRGGTLEIPAGWVKSNEVPRRCGSPRVVGGDGICGRESNSPRDMGVQPCASDQSAPYVSWA